MRWATASLSEPAEIFLVVWSGRLIFCVARAGSTGTGPERGPGGGAGRRPHGAAR
ncbi:hypothetical protein [Nocardia wallacei]|uniref:hypothetical protein n=1 Tax=Nocardia wallacei TaxID=480035 RepID=UPI0024546EAF|nr:hypothetical protein [Nocardia wallacei]